jgi:hypothetical protein
MSMMFGCLFLLVAGVGAAVDFLKLTSISTTATFHLHVEIDELFFGREQKRKNKKRKKKKKKKKATREFFLHFSRFPRCFSL